MKFLLVGLGNPGDEYRETRHNVGFKILDDLAAQAEVKFLPGRYADRAEFRLRGRTFVLIKPQTFMNLSGKAVRYWLDQENLHPERMLVITDDVALPFSKMRMRSSGGAGGHNGLEHIIETLGTKEFPRLRVGIGNEFARGGQVHHVLSEWTTEESEQLPAIIKRTGEASIAFGVLGIARAMNEHNQ